MRGVCTHTQQWEEGDRSDVLGTESLKILRALVQQFFTELHMGKLSFRFKPKWHYIFTQHYVSERIYVTLKAPPRIQNTDYSTFH